MATQAYKTWVNRGRPYEVARPIRELVAYARAHRIAVLGVIGNDEHLQNNRPQDHTPFSVTAWPLPLPGYVVTACDLAGGAWVAQFIAECRAGLRPWVKYVNHAGKQWSVKNGWNPVANSDYHFHVSARTDQLNAPAGRDPWAPVVPDLPDEGEDDMRGILATYGSRATVWYGTTRHGDLRALSNPESVDALAAAGAIQRNFKSPNALVETLGTLPGGDFSASVAAVQSAG